MIAAWSPAATPSLRCPSVSLALSAAMLMSAVSATARPAPTAVPLIAEMMGLEQLVMLRTMSAASRSSRETTLKLPSVDRKSVV